MPIIQCYIPLINSSNFKFTKIKFVIRKGVPCFSWFQCILHGRLVKISQAKPVLRA